MRELCDIAIIGAGAAGLAAGIFAAEAVRSCGTGVPPVMNLSSTIETQAGRLCHVESSAPRIILLDGAKTIGAKILVSGGGRCNVTHDYVHPDDYFGSRTIVRNILAAFDEKSTVKWLGRLGVDLKREETGKLFPATDSARTVLNALLDQLKLLGVQLRGECRVSEVQLAAEREFPPSPGTPGEGRGEGKTVERVEDPHPNPLPAYRARETEPGPFIITHSQGQLAARCVVLCAGGRSLPRTGSDGGGYGIARKLGHHVTETFPALVPLVFEDSMFHAQVSGLSHEAELSTFVEGKLIDRRAGSMLWTHFGVSGPVVMDASRFWVMANTRKQPVELRCNFLPGETFEAVEKAFLRVVADRPKLSIAKAVAQRLPERLRLEIIQRAGIDPALPIGQLSRDLRRKLIHTMTALPLPVMRDRGWNYAEVTAGGVPLEEIDFRTMASRKTPGLFLAGEILDCDGRIGGFNFQWAWATGYLAGKAAAKWVGA